MLRPILALLLSGSAVAAQDAETLSRHALDLVNEARQEQGLGSLALGDDLEEAAQAHAADMLERDFYAHVSPEGDDVADRYTDAGGSEWELVAENIARCIACDVPADLQRVDAFQKGWMNSPGHRANILTAVHDTNQRQKNKLAERVMARLGADLSGKTIAVWGLAFKPNTDDMREAPSRYLLEGVWSCGG